MVAFSFDSATQAHCLSTQIRLPRSIDEIFEFFSDATNLESITPESLCFQITSPQPIEMQSGTLIDYRLKLRLVPIRWRTEISVWEPPFRFVDRQLRGPYRLWEHTHTFFHGEEGTTVCDDVRYRVPGGNLVHRLFVKPELERIFHYRHQRLAKLLGEKKLEAVV